MKTEKIISPTLNPLSEDPETKEFNRIAVNGLIESYNTLVRENIRLNQELQTYKKKYSGRKKILTENQIKFIHSEKLKGLSNRKIAKLLNVSEGTIRNYIKKSEC